MSHLCRYKKKPQRLTLVQGKQFALTETHTDEVRHHNRAHNNQYKY